VWWRAQRPAWQRLAILDQDDSVDGRLYAFGGTSSRAFVYDAGRDAWTEVASMRHSHGGTPAVAVIGGKIYVAGGTGPKSSCWEARPAQPSAAAD